MNHVEDKMLTLIWHLCQTEENEDRNPPDYWFSFERSKRTKLGGLLSKDTIQSYTVRRGSYAPQFSLRNIVDETPDYVSEGMASRSDRLEVLAWAERDDATEAAGLTFGGAVVMVSPEELQRLRNQEKNS